MANSITKIYELKTLGYDRLIQELKNVEKGLENLKIAKQTLNLQKLTTEDADKLKIINSGLKDYTKTIAEATLQRRILIQEIKAQLAIRQTEIESNKAEIGSITQLTDRLKQLIALKKTIAPTSGSTIQFEGQSLNFQQATAKATELNNQIKTLTGNTQGLGSIGQQVTTGLTNGFSRMKGQLGQIILMYTGWFAAFREAGQLIAENIKLSDSFADLQIRIHGTKEDVDNLFESLKKIDTRTSLKDLVDIANTVAKKGVPKEEIAKLTQEFDKLNVVLGKEIGEPGTATASIIKLITIFNDDKHVTAERVQEIGTSLFKLTTTGVATGEFLINFAERVGAVRGITGLTLPNILGMGAALQQLGQRTELAGTAAVQLTTKLFTNIPKFASAARVSIEEFRKLLADNPFDALVKVAEGLKSLGDNEIATNFEEIVQAFGEVGVTGVRIKAVLGDIATNGKFVQQRMHDAAISTSDFANQSVAAELKQHTFAATLERVRKELEVIGTNKTVQVVLAAIGSAVLFLVTNLGTILTVLAIYATAWTIANASMIAARVTAIATNIALTVQYATLVLTSTFLKAYSVSLAVFTRATTLAAGATRLLSIAIASSFVGIGIIIGLIAIFAASCTYLKAKVDGTTDALRKQAERIRINEEIMDKANASIAEQVSNLEALVAIISSTITSYDTKRIALDQLIASNSKFSAALKGNVIDLAEVKRALGEVRAEILLNAQAQAAATLTGDAYKKYLDAIAARQVVERKVATTKDVIKSVFTGKTKAISLDDVPSSVKDAIKNAAQGKYDIGGDIAIDGVAYNSKTIFKSLAQQEQAALDNYQNYLDVSSGIQAKVIDKTNERNKETERLKSVTDAERINNALKQKLSIDDLEAIIKLINTERDKLKEGDPLLSELERKRQIFQDRLDVLHKNKTKKVPGFRGSQLTGDERDDFSTIEANMKAEIILEEKRFAALQLDHRATFDEEIKFTENIRDINIKYLNLKIARLEGEKNLNARELLTLETFRKTKIDLELKAINDIQAIHDREFQQRKSNLKEDLDQSIAAIQLQTKAIEDDPTLTSTKRVQARLDADKKILALQVKFNADVDFLEKQLNQRSNANSKEEAAAISRAKEQVLKDERDLIIAQISDIKVAGSKDISEVNIIFAQLRENILNNDKLTVTQREEALKKLEKLHRFRLLSSELAALSIEFEKIQKLYDADLISEEAYLKAKENLAKKKAEQKDAGKDLKVSDLVLPSSQETQKLVSDRLAKLFGFEEGSGESKLLAHVISDAFSTAQFAMNAYFNAEENRIKSSLKLAEDRLDVEKEQVKSRAQSQAELDSIDKQYASKKLKLEQEAGEKLKKIKRSEAKIALATELANIAVAAAANPLNGPTLGVAGIVMYAVLAALAFARYSSNVNAINKEQFAHGGGITKGRTHAQGGEHFKFQGRVYEDEVDEINVIRTRDARPNSRYAISGTQTEIASMLNRLGGGIHFKPGATLHKTFETGGFLGSRFQAPAFRGSSSQSGSDELLVEIRNLANEQSKRLDRLQVEQVTDTVTSAQRKQVKQSNIGTL